MTREEIEKLDKTISKRLGKKANALWQLVLKDLAVVNIIRNNITKVTKVEKIPIKDSFNYEMYVSYVSKKAYEQDRIFLMKWLIENIDKDVLREWLDEVKVK